MQCKFSYSNNKSHSIQYIRYSLSLLTLPPPQWLPAT